MKCSFTNTFTPDRKKKLSPAVVPKNIKKCCKKWFVQARKFVYTNLNEAFVEKYVSIIQKNCFFWQENQRKWFWKCFSLKLVPLIFINRYQHQRKSSEQKHSVSTRQNISFTGRNKEFAEKYVFTIWNPEKLEGMVFTSQKVNLSWNKVLLLTTFFYKTQ